MNKTKRVLSVVLAVLMLSSLIAALAIADGNIPLSSTMFSEGKQAAPSWTATSTRAAVRKDCNEPEVVGYTPDQPTLMFSLTT